MHKFATAPNHIFAAGRATVCFESAVLFSYSITRERTQVLTPRPTANTGH